MGSLIQRGGGGRGTDWEGREGRRPHFSLSSHSCVVYQLHTVYHDTHLPGLPYHPVTAAVCYDMNPSYCLRCSCASGSEMERWTAGFYCGPAQNIT